MLTQCEDTVTKGTPLGLPKVTEIIKAITSCFVFWDNEVIAVLVDRKTGLRSIRETAFPDLIVLRID